MDLVDTLHGIVERSMDAYGLSDLAMGVVTKVNPLEITVRESMAPLPAEVLRLTAAVVEKKIPLLAHRHVTSGFRHGHSIPGLSHAHSAPEGATGPALEGEYQTGQALAPDAYPSDERLENIVCYEHGKPLPVEGGYIILNRGLSVGDKVLMLRVARGQQFIILSRIFEGGGSSGGTATVKG